MATAVAGLDSTALVAGSEDLTAQGRDRARVAPRAVAGPTTTSPRVAR